MEILICFYIVFIAIVMPQIISYRSYSNYKEFYKNIDTLKPKGHEEVINVQIKMWGAPVNWSVDNFNGSACCPKGQDIVGLFDDRLNMIADNLFGKFAPLTNKWHNKVLKAIKEKSNPGSGLKSFYIFYP